MIGDAKKRLSDKVLLNEFSASGNFVNRFTALYPNCVQSVVNHMPIFPIEMLDDIVLTLVVLAVG